MNEARCNDRRVLIVEDDRDVREALSEVLEDNSYCPIQVANGKEAIDRLRADTSKPCLILLDVMMPIMDGWQFRAAQSQDPELGAIPVVVLTAHANAEQTARAMHAASFLKKPVQIDALLDLVERFCPPSS